MEIVFFSFFPLRLSSGNTLNFRDDDISVTMVKNKNEIQSYYKDKIIFITGASGYMGKVLLEKLLYSCLEIDKIYLLIRGKKGHSSDTRLNSIFHLPVRHRANSLIPFLLMLYNTILLYIRNVCCCNMSIHLHVFKT